MAKALLLQWPNINMCKHFRFLWFQRLFARTTGIEPGTSRYRVKWSTTKLLPPQSLPVCGSGNHYDPAVLTQPNLSLWWWVTCFPGPVSNLKITFTPYLGFLCTTTSRQPCCLSFQAPFHFCYTPPLPHDFRGILAHRVLVTCMQGIVLESLQ